ncbi:MAG: AAA family ATPase [Desulfatitalea sp.]|nr:AAA family ATPase [Desulfatitalea sp.]NNJ99379.1 AAA family ATPase [Desulfatitalea sp.]
MTSYRIFFEMKREPFAADVELEHILVTPALNAVSERMHYAMNIGAMALVTGEIGSGKSTALRYVTEKLHPSEYRSLYIVATTGAISELYRQLLHTLGACMKGVSKAIMLQSIKNELYELVHGKKLKTVLVIDEASLLRIEVFAELHTLTQFEKDSKPYLPIVLAGQSNLVDSLMYRASMPLASRIVARSHLEGVSRAQMHEYLQHHLAICGTAHDIFDEAAVTAIHQGSGGLFRKANHLARGAIIIAAKNKSMTVTADHVRMAASEIF